MPIRRLNALLSVLLLAAVLCAPGAARGDENATERWYETIRNGQKLGHSRVVWSPSTWEGHATVHDTTTFVTRSVRTMGGMRDDFETVTLIDIERGEDGTLWWKRDLHTESGRTTTTEITWTGSGYEYVEQMEGRERRLVIPLEEPVVIDSEPVVGSRIRAGTLEVGQTFEVRLLDLVSRGATVTEIKVVARETIPDGGAPVGEDGQPAEIACFRIEERNPKTGSSNTMWLDDSGSYVKLVAEGGVVQQRVSKESAERAPVRPAEYSITTPSTPPLERIMSADQVWLDLKVQGDADRRLPEFPDSPWSRVLSVEGDDEAGWVFKMRLDAHQVPDATTTLPIAPEGFERHLEHTVLMPSQDERILRQAKQIVGAETDARKAAWLLARWVYDTLAKQSPSVAQASAVEILESERGDCSEHALLFTTFCRAVGIPARQCSGYVCIGSMWGAHAWCEIWLGEWVGADPTTGEIGTGARYVFFGYHDDPESQPGLVTVRARGRMRFVVTRLVEGADDVDLSTPAGWTLHDREHGRYVHALAGLEARDAPKDWVIRMIGQNRALIRGDGFRADITATADQGARLLDVGWALDEFAGQPARVISRGGQGGTNTFVLVQSRRRLIEVRCQGENGEDGLARLEEVFAPTFAPVPLPWVAPTEDSEDPDDEDEPDEDANDEDANDEDEG